MTDTVVAFQAVQFSVMFLEEEDRLLLLASDAAGAQEALVFTRRLTARFINGLAALLEQSNVVASTAPSELRNDIVLMEHQGAVFGLDASPSGEAQGQSPAASTGETVQVRPRLVTAAQITMHPADFHMVLQAPGGLPVAVVLNRFDLHRVVELLKRKAEDAGWNLQIDVGWLGDDKSLLTIN